MKLQTKIFGGGKFDLYLKPEVDVFDINVEYGFALSASTASDDEDQIKALEDDENEDYDF